MRRTRQETEYEFDLNPYESFMKRHLQHYGYYTGRNQNYRSAFQTYEEWEKTYDYNVPSDDSHNDDSDGQNDEQDNKLQEELLRTTQLVYSYEAGRMVPKLREPRNLYALAKEAGPQQAARWPVDLQVQDETVKHIRYVPTESEIFYKLTGMEHTPMCRGEGNGGRLVFNYDPKNTFYVRSRVGGCRSGCDTIAHIPKSKEDTTLVFESRFESGNLAKAVQVAENDYELWLRYDLYTTKHTQWFYFRVANTRANVKYRFTIVNFMKSDSLYNYGMKPLQYSEKDALQNKVGWLRYGSDIKYYRNNLRYETSRGERPFYSLTWTTKFNHGHDNVYFSHCYPYTYTDLQDYLLELNNDPIKASICKQRVLCRTLAGNLVYVLTVTSPSSNPEDIKHKKAVVLTSRVHPGESNSSWMMKGFLDYLTGTTPDAKLLRDTFIFKIIPMLNPDGVIVGNYRCSLTGRDLNRNYKTLLKESYPSVWHTKNMIRKLSQERDIILYCDLHGHSRKQNVFIYGCENKHIPSRRLRERVFPCMLGKNAPDEFSYNCCKFKVQKSKEGTGRIVMWNMGIMNSFTMEATFCGSSLGKKKGYHFTVADYEALGYHFCDTLLDYCDPDNTKNSNILIDLEERIRLEIIARMEKDGVSPGDIDVADFSSDFESSDGGSDSSASDGPPVHLQFAAARTKKKKKLKSRRERSKEVDKVQLPEKPASEIHQKKTLISPMKIDKVASHPFRYSSATKRPRSQDDRNNNNNGIPLNVKERCDERQQKRTDYLEALTAAYLRNGIPILNPPVFVKLDPIKVPHFCYSSNSHAPRNLLPFRLEGLCPHHEQYLVQHAGQNNTGATSEVTVEDYLCTRTSARYGRQPPRHLVEISAAQQRQQDIINRYQGSSIRQHPNPFEDQMHRTDEHRHLRVPSETRYNHYREDEIEHMDTEGMHDSTRNLTNNEQREKCVHKSKIGLVDSEEMNKLRAFSTNDLTKLSTSNVLRQPRVHSAHGDGDMDNIRQLKQSLSTAIGSQNISPSTGTYIRKLMQETSEEIDHLTTELKGDIEEKERRKTQEKIISEGTSHIPLKHDNHSGEVTHRRSGIPSTQRPEHRVDNPSDRMFQLESEPQLGVVPLIRGHSSTSHSSREEVEGRFQPKYR